MNRDDITRMAREAGYTIRQFDGVDEVMDGDNYHIQTDKVEEFAALVAAAEREACGRVKAAKPRKLKPVGIGMLLDEQQYCFEKGWREGAASVRAAIRARGKG